MLASKAKRKSLKLTGTGTSSSRCLKSRNGDLSSQCSNAKSKKKEKVRNGTTTVSNCPKAKTCKSKIPIPIPKLRNNPILHKEVPYNGNKLENKLGLLNRSISTSISFRSNPNEQQNFGRFSTPVMGLGLTAEQKELERRNLVKKTQVITPVMSADKVAGRLKEVQQHGRINRLKQFDINRLGNMKIGRSTAEEGRAKFKNQSVQNSKAEILRNARIAAYENRVKQLYKPQPKTATLSGK